MTTDTIVFPRCGLSLGDVLAVTEKPIPLAVAARKLGVSSTQLDRVASNLGIKDRFLNRLDALENFAFPAKGILVEDVVSAASEEPNLRAAAKRLQVSERRLHDVAKRHGIEFQKKKPRASSIDAAEVRSLANEGYTQKDAAYIAGTSYGNFKRIARRYKLNHLFPSSGQAAAISRRGYTGSDFF